MISQNNFSQLLTNREQRQRIISGLEQECGNVFLNALANDDIVELIVNPDGTLWLDSQRNGMFATEYNYHELNVYSIICAVADLSKKIINEENPILETEFPLDGSRFEGVFPPVSEGPSFTLRKKAKKIYTLNDYISSGILKAGQAKVLRRAIQNRQSILVVGGPGTGKTTFLNALLLEMVNSGDKNQRFVILEDTRELQCSAKNTLYLKVSNHVDFQKLLRVALRSRPDKICMGECRGAEMLTLLKAWNTGTPGGLATLHANSAESALIRITEMIEESGSRAQHALVCESVDLIISLEFSEKAQRRQVSQLVSLAGYNKESGYQFEVH